MTAAEPGPQQGGPQLDWLLQELRLEMALRLLRQQALPHGLEQRRLQAKETSLQMHVRVPGVVQQLRLLLLLLLVLVQRLIWEQQRSDVAQVLQYVLGLLISQQRDSASSPEDQDQGDRNTQMRQRQ